MEDTKRKEHERRKELSEETLFNLSEEQFFVLTATCICDYIKLNNKNYGAKDIEAYMYNLMMAIQVGSGNEEYVESKKDKLKEIFYDNAITV